MKRRVIQFAALFLALSLLLSACGGGKENAAATIHLIKTEGTVEVDDVAGKSVKPIENLGLFSGYALATLADSYGWINMDGTRLAKMDALSQVDITKEDKLLELNVRSGNLFFNVTRPLEADETMNIRTSTMMVGIRGTCGWVEVEDESLMCVYLLRGQVECMVLDGDGGILAMETITAGQAALMRLEDGEASITVAEFDTRQVPAFVQEALDSPEDWGVEADGAEENASNPDPPRMLSRTFYRVDDNSVMGYDEYLYDGDGKYTGYKTYQVKDNKWVEGQEMQEEFDERGWLKRQLSTYTGVRGEILHTDSHVLESTAEYVTIGSEEYEDLFTRYYYNSLGQCIREENFIEGGCYAFTTYEYDSQGKIVGANRYRTNGPGDDRRITGDQHICYFVYEYEGDPGAPSGRPVLDGETSGAEEAAPLSAYAGTYTLYPEYEPYRSGYGGATVTLHGDGTVTGGAVDGRSPSNIRQEGDGSIVIQYSGTMWFTLYPANGPAPSAAWYDGGQVNLEFMDASGGLAVLVYHADPADVGMG